LEPIAYPDFASLNPGYSHGGTRARAGRATMSSTTFDLISPLPPRECARRLRAAIDGGWTMGGSKPVLGSVSDKSIRLRKRMYYRNSFQCWLSAKFVEEDGQTRLHCTVGLHPFVRIFLEYWVGGVLLAGGFIIVRTIRAYFSDPDPLPPNLWLGIAGPLVMLGFGGIMLTLGDYLSGDEPRFLIEFVERTIDAREA
jgi:hypothetical protein